jgi:hypothetical protein
MVVEQSTFAFNGPVQRDGSQWVRERHDLADGTTREFYYLLAPNDDVNLIMSERAAAIETEAQSDGE